MNNALSQCALPYARLLAIASAITISYATAGFAAGETASAQIAAVKAAATRYADINAALTDGYIPDPSGHCVSAAAEGLPAEWGAMGLHYLNPARLGITATEPRVDGNGLNIDFFMPSILLYEPQADGSMRLVGAENLVFEKAWKEAGNAEAPVFAGREWDHMSDDPATPGDEAHGFMPHYDQHVWFVDNPAGDLMPFNPNITCEHMPAHQ